MTRQHKCRQKLESLLVAKESQTLVIKDNHTLHVAKEH